VGRPLDPIAAQNAGRVVASRESIVYASSEIVPPSTDIVRTRAGPRARAHRNATTALSIPPETPTTAPCRRKRPVTASRTCAEIRSTSADGSIRIHAAP
jgi:hypothetical protein